MYCVCTAHIRYDMYDMQDTYDMYMMCTMICLLCLICMYDKNDKYDEYDSMIWKHDISTLPSTYTSCCLFCRCNDTAYVVTLLSQEVSFNHCNTRIAAKWDLYSSRNLWPLKLYWQTLSSLNITLPKRFLPAKPWHFAGASFIAEWLLMYPWCSPMMASGLGEKSGPVFLELFPEAILMQVKNERHIFTTGRSIVVVILVASEFSLGTLLHHFDLAKFARIFGWNSPSSLHHHLGSTSGEKITIAKVRWNDVILWGFNCWVCPCCQPPAPWPWKDQGQKLEVWSRWQLWDSGFTKKYKSHRCCNPAWAFQLFALAFHLLSWPPHLSWAPHCSCAFQFSCAAHFWEGLSNLVTNFSQRLAASKAKKTPEKNEWIECESCTSSKHRIFIENPTYILFHQKKTLSRSFSRHFSVWGPASELEIQHFAWTKSPYHLPQQLICAPQKKKNALVPDSRG